MLNNINNRGFAMGAIIATMFMLSSAIVLSSKVTDTVRSAQRYFSGSSTKSSMAIIRDFLIQRSADVDNDGHFELLKEGAGNTIPLSIPINPVDSYGTEYRYCTWDAGTLNSVDATYSQNNAAPPVAGLIGRIISGGSDRNITTDCAATVADGDDILLEVLENSVNYSNAALGGWSDKGNYMAQLNPTDKIITGAAAIPTHQLEVMGGNTAANGLAIGNVEIFNSGGNTAQINVIGGMFNINGGGLQMSGVTIVDASRNITAATLVTTGNSSVGGSLTVTGVTIMNSALTANGGIATTTLTTSGLATLNSLAVTNNASVGGTLTVTGGLTANGGISAASLTTSGAATLNSLGVTNNATVGGTLAVTGAVNLSSGVLQMGGTTIFSTSRNMIGVNGLGQNLLPTATNTYSLGSGGAQYLNMYALNVYQNGNKVIDTAAFFGTTNYLTKFTGTNSAGNSLVYDNGSMVFIGATADNGSGAKFQVNGYAAGSTGLIAGTGAGPSAVFINSAQSAINDLTFQSVGLSRWIIRRNTDTETGGDAGSNLDFISRTDTGLAKSTVMRLARSTGNVLMGGNTDDGYNKLQITGSVGINAGATGALILSSSTSTDTDSPKLALWGATSAGKTSVGPSLQGVTSGAWGLHDLVFWQHNSDDYTSSYEAGRVTAKGNWLLGAGVVNDNTSRLQVAGDINLQSGSMKYPDGTSQNSASGTAKAWVRWSWPNTIQASYNVASITNNGNGTVTIVFASPMTDSNYAVALSTNNSAADAQQRGLVVSGVPTTTSITIAAPVSQSICSAVIYK